MIGFTNRFGRNARERKNGIKQFPGADTGEFRNSIIPTTHWNNNLSAHGKRLHTAMGIIIPAEEKNHAKKDGNGQRNVI